MKKRSQKPKTPVRTFSRTMPTLNDVVMAMVKAVESGKRYAKAIKGLIKRRERKT